MRFLYAVVILALSQTVFALPQIYQTLNPATGQHEARLGYLLQKVDVQSDTGGKSVGTGYRLPFQYFYGVTEYGAIGFTGGLAESNSEFTAANGTKSSFKSTGLEGLTLKWKGNSEVGITNLYYSAGYYFGLEKSKIDGTKDEANNSPSQPEIQVELGVVYPVSAINLGAIFQYGLAQTGSEESVSAGATSTVTGGGQTWIKLIAEFTEFYNFNVELGFQNRYGNKLERNGVSTLGSSNQELYRFSFSSRHAANANLEIIPELNYITPKEKPNLTKFDIFYIGANARFLF